MNSRVRRKASITSRVVCRRSSSALATSRVKPAYTESQHTKHAGAQAVLTDTAKARVLPGRECGEPLLMEVSNVDIKLPAGNRRRSGTRTHRGIFVHTFSARQSCIICSFNAFTADSWRDRKSVV